MASLGLNLNVLDAIEKLLGTPVDSANPQITWGMVWVFVFLLFVVAKIVSDRG